MITTSGATYDPVADVKAKIAAGEKTISIPKGTYVVSPEASARPIYFKFVGLKDTVIDFNGSELRGKVNTRFFDLAGCTNVTIRNVKLDYVELPFTQAVIEKVGADGEWDVRICKGYPDHGRDMSEVRGESEFWPLQAYDAKTRELTNPMRFRKDTKFTRTGEGTYRITGGIDRRGKVGDIAVWCVYQNGRRYISENIVMESCADLVWENVTQYTTPYGRAFFERKTDHTRYLKCQLVRRPPEEDFVKREVPRLRSGNHDFIISQMARRGPIVDGCVAEYHCDDCVNIGAGPSMLLVSSQGRRARVLSWGKEGLRFAAGDSVQVVTPDGRILPNLKTVSVTPDRATTPEEAKAVEKCGLWPGIAGSFRKGWLVEFDRDLSDVPPYTALTSEATSAAGFEIKNCRFGSTRARGLLLKCANGIVDNCTIKASISLYGEYEWMTCFVARNIRISNCTLSSPVTLGSCVVHGKRIPVQPNASIVLENNRIVNAARSAPVATAEVWRMHELSFESKGRTGDAVEMDVVYTCGGQKLKRPAFWDGGRTYRVRFAAPQAGRWTWRTECAGEKSLDGLTGSVNVKPYGGRLEIYRRGFVRTQKGLKHFVYADGTPFLYLGDTHWGFGIEAEEDAKDATARHVETVVKRRVEQGFTVWQSEPNGCSFYLADGSVDANDISGLRTFDHAFRTVADAGLVHANAQFFFPSQLKEPVASDTNALRRLARHWVARFGAYPVMWTLGQEVDNDMYYPKQNKTWTAAKNPYVWIAQCLHEFDCYSHPLTAHQENTQETTVTGVGTRLGTKGGASIFADTNLAARCGHDWWGVQWSPRLNGPQRVDVLKDYWRDPRVAINYEGRYCGLWTMDFGARAQVWISFLSGMFGQGYGAADLWLYHSNYDMKNPTTNEIEVVTVAEKHTPWRQALEFPSANQMRHFRSFMDGINWWRLEPDFGEGKCFRADPALKGAFAAAHCSSMAVAYVFNRKSRATGSFVGLAKNANYSVKFFNPRTGEWMKLGEKTSDETGSILMPERPDLEDWVLSVELKDLMSDGDCLQRIDFTTNLKQVNSKGKGEFKGVLPQGVSENAAGWSGFTGTSAIENIDGVDYLVINTTAGKGQFHAALTPKVVFPGKYRVVMEMLSPDCCRYNSFKVSFRGGSPGYRSHWNGTFEADGKQSIFLDLPALKANEPRNRISLFFYTEVGAVYLRSLAIYPASEAEIAAAIRRPDPSVKEYFRVGRFADGLPADWTVDRNVCAYSVGRGDAADDGAPTLRLKAEEPLELYSPPFQTNEPHEPHRLAFNYKCRGEFSVTVLGDSKRQVCGQLALKPSEVWKSAELKFSPLAKSESFSLRFNGVGELQLDNLSVRTLANAELPASYATFLALKSVPGEVGDDSRIYFETETPRVNVSAIGLGAADTIRLETEDLYGRRTVRTVKPGVADFPGMALGQFLVRATAFSGECQVSAPTELVFTRVRRPVRWGVDAPDSQFGGHFNAVTPMIRRMKALGINWVRFHDASTECSGWWKIEPTPGEWKFPDEKIARFRDNHVKIFAQLGTAPKWATYFDRLGYSREDYFTKYLRPTNMVAWTTYVRKYVGHYRDRIDSYFIWNEPWGSWWRNSKDVDFFGGKEKAEAEFAEFSIHTYKAAKDVFPDVDISGFNGCRGNWKWSEGVMKGGGFAACDSIDYHTYSRSRRLMRPDEPATSAEVLAPIRKVHPDLCGKPVVLSEGQGYSSGAFSTKTDRFSGLYRDAVPWERETTRALAKRADMQARYVVSILSEGVKRIFLYTQHGYTSLGFRPNFISLVGADGMPDPTAVAISHLATLIEGRKFVKAERSGENGYVWYFRGEGDRAGTVGIHSGLTSSEVLSLTGRVTDIYGNPPTRETILSHTLVYTEK